MIIALLLFINPLLFGEAFLEKKYFDYTLTLCLEYEIPIDYAVSMILAESNGNPLAENINPNGTWDRGMLQHNEKSIEDFRYRYNNGTKYDPFNWEDNIRIGLSHLATMKKHTGTWKGAITAYNMGLTGYREYLEGKRKMKPSTKRLLALVFKE